MSQHLLNMCSVAQGLDFGLEKDFRVRIMPDGRVTYQPNRVFRTTCSVDLYYFPYDVQNCSVCLLTWVHSKEYLDYK